jgi:hypothetical protein
VGVGFTRVYADLVQGCLWEYHVLLSLPCGLRLPQWSGHWHLAAREPSWFLYLTWSGNAMHRVGVWRSGSWWFSCKVYFQCLSKILL